MDKPLVLVVDDNPTQQMLLSLVARKCGFDVVIAASGVQALEAIKKTGLANFDLILMDWRMPDMDGLECTKVVREREKDTKRHVPIIGLTASAMSGDRQKCMEAGMDDYMTKPFSIANLRQVMDSWMNKGDTVPNVYPLRPAGTTPGNVISNGF
jgi:CheY-like chemotaxis protein